MIPPEVYSRHDFAPLAIVQPRQVIFTVNRLSDTVS